MNSLKVLKKALEIRSLLVLENLDKTLLNNQELVSYVDIIKRLQKVKGSNLKACVDNLMSRHENVYEIGVYILAADIKETSEHVLQLLLERKTSNEKYLTPRLQLLCVKVTLRHELDICKLVCEAYDLERILHLIEPQLRRLVKERNVHALNWLSVLNSRERIDLEDILYFFSNNHFDPLRSHLVSTCLSLHWDVEEAIMEILTKLLIDEEGDFQRVVERGRINGFDFTRAHQFHIDLLFYCSIPCEPLSLTGEQKLKWFCSYSSFFFHHKTYDELFTECLPIASETPALRGLFLKILMLMDHLEYATFLAQADQRYRSVWPLSYSPNIIIGINYIMKLRLRPIEPLDEFSLIDLNSVSQLQRIQDFQKHKKICSIGVRKMFLGDGHVSVIGWCFGLHVCIVDVLAQHDETLLTAVYHHLHRFTVTGFNVHLDWRTIWSLAGKPVTEQEQRIFKLKCSRNASFEKINSLLESNGLPVLKLRKDVEGWNVRPIPENLLHDFAREVRMSYSLCLKTYKLDKRCDFDTNKSLTVQAVKKETVHKGSSSCESCA